MSYSREQGIVLKGLLEAINIICLDLEPAFMSIVTTSCAKHFSSMLNKWPYFAAFPSNL